MLAQRVQAFRSAAGRSSASRSRLTVVCKDSRIGRAPITVPKGVTVTIDGQTVRVKVRAAWSVRGLQQHVGASQPRLTDSALHI